MSKSCYVKVVQNPEINFFVFNYSLLTDFAGFIKDKRFYYKIGFNDINLNTIEKIY